MIAEGRVKIGEAVLTTPATVLENLKGVTVDGKPVKSAEAARLFRFHKPSGLITAERDPAGRPTIYTALRNALPPGTPRLMPVGPAGLQHRGPAADDQRRRTEARDGTAQLGHPAHLPRPHLRHDHPGAAGGADRGRDHRGHPLRQDRRQHGAQHRAQPVDRTDPDRGQEPRSAPGAGTSRPRSFAAAAHRLWPVRCWATCRAAARTKIAARCREVPRSAAQLRPRRGAGPGIEEAGHPAPARQFRQNARFALAARRWPAQPARA